VAGLVPPVQVGSAKPPLEQVAPTLVSPAEQANWAESPAVQAFVAVPPAVQSMGLMLGALPSVQTPLPLAILPKSNITGVSYLDF